MPGMILAVLDDPADTLRLLRAAARLADLIGGATVDALIARAPPHTTILRGEELLTKRQEERIRAQEEARAGAVARAFADWLAGADRAAHLSDVEAVAADIVAARGTAADSW